MSAPSARRVAGGRWAVTCVYIPIVKSRKKVDSPQLASLRPGTCYVVREGISSVSSGCYSHRLDAGHVLYGELDSWLRRGDLLSHRVPVTKQ